MSEQDVSQALPGDMDQAIELAALDRWENEGGKVSPDESDDQSKEREL